MLAPPQTPVLSDQDRFIRHKCSRERLLVVLCVKRACFCRAHTSIFWNANTFLIGLVFEPQCAGQMAAAAAVYVA